MGKIVTTAEWHALGIYQLQVTDPIIGGGPTFDAFLDATGGYANAQAKILADRQLAVKDYIQAIIDGDLGTDTGLGTPAVPSAPGIKAHVLRSQHLQRGVLPSEVRNSILSGPFDGNGKVAAITDAGYPQIQIDGSVVPIIFSFAAGYDDFGAVDYYKKYTGTWTFDISTTPGGSEHIVVADYDTATDTITFQVLTGLTFADRFVVSPEDPGAVVDSTWLNPFSWEVKRGVGGPAWSTIYSVPVAIVSYSGGVTTIKPYEYRKVWNPQEIIPAGTVSGWPQDITATTGIPEGWLECDGTAVSRATYWRLFALIGTQYGVGDSSTTFNLPDYQGYFLRGLDDRAVGGFDTDAPRTIGDTQSDFLYNTGILAADNKSIVWMIKY